MRNNTNMHLRSWWLVFSILIIHRSGSFADAQQAPFFTTPQFSDVSHRTNVCDRFAAYASGNLPIRDALAGLNLTVGVVDQPNDLYFKLHRSNMSIDEYAPGIFVEILDELAKRANFSWRYSYARILPPNLTENADATWTDVLVDSVERYDLSFAEWVHTNERRRRGVNFPVGWYDTSTIFIRDTREGLVKDFNFGSWTRPLHWTLWCLYALGFIYNRTMLWMLDKIQREWDGTTRLITSKQKVFRTRMVEIVFDADRSNGKRLHGMSASLFNRVFVASFVANLANSLIAQNQPDFNYVSMDDLDARFVPVCVRQGDAVFESLSNDYESMNYIRSGDQLQNYQRLLRGECDVVATRRADFDIYERNPIANPDCTLEWVGRPEYINYGGMATLLDTNSSCTSLVGHVLDLHMHEMADFLEQAWQRYLEAQSNYVCPAKVQVEDTRYSLTLNDIGGFFIVFAGMAMLGMLVTIIEQYFERKRKRKLAAAEEAKQNTLTLQENNGTSSHVNMLGQVSDNAHITTKGNTTIPVDADVLKRILVIDRTIAKLHYQISGEKRPSVSSSSRNLMRGSGSQRSMFSAGSHGGGTSSPRNSGSWVAGGSAPASPRRSGGAIAQRPSLAELGKPLSQQNILALE